MIREETIRVEGRIVNYLIKPVNNPAATVVFVHGFPFSCNMWQDQLAHLPENVQGLAVDLRGFGKSDAGHNYFTIDLFARDILELAQKLSLPNVVLCGISMGGYIVLRAFQVSSERISGLILCDTNAVADSDEARLKRFSTIDQIQQAGKLDFAESFVKNIFSETTFSGNVSVVNFIKDIILKTPDNTICSALLALASRTDTTAVLNEITVPALVIRGAEDKLMSEEQAEQLYQGISSAEYRIIPRSAHLPNLENPEVFNFELNTFLNKHFSF